MASISDPWADPALLKKIMDLQNAKKKLSEEFREEEHRNPQAVLNQINGLLSAIKALHYA